MTGQQVRDARKRQGFTQPQLAVVLSEALGRPIADHTIGRWERGSRKVPPDVEKFLFALNRGDTPAAGAGAGEPELEPAGPDKDSAPGAGDGFGGPPEPQQPLTSSGSKVYAAACTELWELAGTTISMLGAVLGNPRLVISGQIVDGDKRALGEAYGKLAETNETFRKMLVGMTQGGAMMQVAVVTAVTGGKVMQVWLPGPGLEADPAGNGASSSGGVYGAVGAPAAQP